MKLSHPSDPTQSEIPLLVGHTLPLDWAWRRKEEEETFNPLEEEERMRVHLPSTTTELLRSVDGKMPWPCSIPHPAVEEEGFDA